MNPSQEDLEEAAKLLFADPFYFKQDLNFVVENIQQWRLILMGVLVAVMINGSYAIVLWTSYKVWKHLKIMEIHMSAQTRNAHNQMTKAMIAQALIPFIFNLMPIFISLMMVIFFVNVDGLGVGISLIYCWIPVANSLTTIFVIKHYRNFLLRLPKQFFNRHFSTALSTTISSNQFSAVIKPENILTSVKN